MESTHKTVVLHNGFKLPVMGMGTYPLRGSAMDTAVDAALSYGYRVFDTAYGYQNDDSLGNSLEKYLHKHELVRENIVLASKVGDKLDNGRPLGAYFYNSDSCIRRDIKNIVQEQIDSSLRNLKTDYIDLMLIHYPYPDYFIEIWYHLEAAYQAGKIKAIGVSNFRERHLKQIIDNCQIKPMVNQFEHHPLNTKKELIKFCHEHTIQMQASSPLLMMNKKLMNSEILLGLSAKYSKSIPQVILKWNMQLGIIPIPKSGNPARLKSNIDIFDFSLTTEEIQLVDTLNEDYKLLPESTNCPGY